MKSRFRRPSGFILAALLAGCGDGGDVTSPPDEVASIEISPDTAILRLTAKPTFQLTATAENAAGEPLTDRAIAWTSSDPTLATVSATGQVKAADSGWVIITASSEGRSGTAFAVLAPDEATALCTDGWFSRSQTRSGTCANHGGVWVWLEDPAPPPAGNGSLRVTTSTTGPSPDADGYAVSIDGGAGQAIGANATLTLPDIPAKAHTVGLSGIAGNCQLEGENPLTVTVSAGNTALAVFAINCTEPPPSVGTLRVTTETSGPAPDPNGYTFAVDGGAGQPIGANSTVSVSNLVSGAHGVELSGVAANCTLEGTNPRSVSIPAGGTAELSFSITCQATSGSLKVTTTTSGPSPDPDGYLVSLDGAPGLAIGAGASLTIADLVPGPHSVSLSEVADNCAIEGDAQRTVTIVAGEEVTVAFSISCSTPPPSLGTLRVTTTTTGSDLDPDGYSIAIGQRPEQPIGVNATMTIVDLPEGQHRVELGGLAANCTVQGANPRTVTVPTGGTVEVGFNVTCEPKEGSVAAVEVTPDTAILRLTAKLTLQLTATPKDAAGEPLTDRAITWESSDPAVAAVSNVGLVSALDSGVVDVWATSEGRSDTALVVLAPDDAMALCNDSTFSRSQNRSGTCSSHLGVWVWLEGAAPPPNVLPVAGDDAYSVLEDEVLEVPAPGVLGNDQDADGDALTAALAAGPSQDTPELAPDGGFRYTPAPDFSGDVTFTYTAQDGAGGQATGSVTITVQPVNDAPGFTASTTTIGVSALEGAQVVPGWATGITAGPGEEVQALEFVVSVAEGQELFDALPAVSSDGTLTYDPGAPGIVTVEVRLRDSGGTQNGGVNTSDPVLVTFDFDG